jgi:hypothetical protein
MAETPETNKPDFRNGFPILDLRDGSMISGRADGEELVLGHRGDECFAIGATAPTTALASRRKIGQFRFLRDTFSPFFRFLPRHSRARPYGPLKRQPV